MSNINNSNNSNHHNNAADGDGSTYSRNKNNNDSLSSRSSRWGPPIVPFPNSNNSGNNGNYSYNDYEHDHYRGGSSGHTTSYHPHHGHSTSDDRTRTTSTVMPPPPPPHSSSRSTNRRHSNHHHYYSRRDGDDDRGHYHQRQPQQQQERYYTNYNSSNKRRVVIKRRAPRHDHHDEDNHHHHLHHNNNKHKNSHHYHHHHRHHKKRRPSSCEEPLSPPREEETREEGTAVATTSNRHTTTSGGGSAGSTTGSASANHSRPTTTTAAASAASHQSSRSLDWMPPPPPPQQRGGAKQRQGGGMENGRGVSFASCHPPTAPSADDNPAAIHNNGAMTTTAASTSKREAEDEKEEEYIGLDAPTTSSSQAGMPMFKQEQVEDEEEKVGRTIHPTSSSSSSHCRRQLQNQNLSIKQEEEKDPQHNTATHTCGGTVIDLLMDDIDDNDKTATATSGQNVIDLLTDEEDNDDDDTKDNGPSSDSSETHIIFAIDFSSSMRANDVKTKDRGRISRWDAVFECIGSVLEEQLSTQNNSNVHDDDDDDSNDDDGNNNSNTSAIVTVIIFNDDAQTILERMPLAGDGQKILKALDTARRMHKPKLGTCFSAGFERAKLIATTNSSENAIVKKEPGQTTSNNVMLVFLSDGRPGDLRSQAPSNAQIPMQMTFRRKKQTYPAAGVHIEAMQQEHGERFNLQLICLSEEGTHWLQYLAQRYNGTFHKPNLALDEDTPDALEQAPAVASLAGNYASDGNGGNGSDDSDDEVVEMVGYKSQDTLIRERYNLALAAGNVHSLTTTTTTATRGSSMRSTFQSISSTVTDMRKGTGRSSLQERQGVILAANSPMIGYEATRMVLDADHEKISVASGEQAHSRRVNVSMHPFAQGGLRNVYRMKQSGEPRQVAKESRHDIKYQERLKFHFETAKCQAQAQTYAKTFNKKLKKSKLSLKRIKFLRAEVYRLVDPRYPGGFRYLAVEDEMKGQNYEKWNSNNGYVNDADSAECQVAQAFSHFSYETSKQKEMVVDIQGSGFTYTDPQLHSRGKQFGRADRGDAGFKDFFKTHKCNFICEGLGLRNRSAPAAAVAKSTSRPFAVKQESERRELGVACATG